jgi:hypothetical protein
MNKRGSLALPSGRARLFLEGMVAEERAVLRVTG